MLPATRLECDPQTRLVCSTTAAGLVLRLRRCGSKSPLHITAVISSVCHCTSVSSLNTSPAGSIRQKHRCSKISRPVRLICLDQESLSGEEIIFRKRNYFLTLSYFSCFIRSLCNVSIQFRCLGIIIPPIC